MHKLSKSYVDICAIYHQVMALFLPAKLCPYDYFFTSYEQAVQGSRLGQTQIERRAKNLSNYVFVQMVYFLCEESFGMAFKIKCLITRSWQLVYLLIYPLQAETYSSVLNNRPVTLGPDSLLSFNTGKGEVDNRGLMLSTLEQLHPQNKR